jgi:hypothetical protein
MGVHDLHRHVEINDGGRTVAVAEVTAAQGSEGTVRVSLRAESGHIPPGSRARLVDAVLDLPEVRGCERLEAAFPLGDSESLQRLQQRCEGARIHPAGVSAILHANIASGGGAR